MTRWIEATSEDIKIGELVKIIETHKDGSTITYEGKPQAVNPTLAQFSGGSAWLQTNSGRWYTVQLFRAAPELPTTVGSVILVPGVGAAVRSQTGWFRTDTGHRVGQAELVNAEILFTV